MNQEKSSIKRNSLASEVELEAKNPEQEVAEIAGSLAVAFLEQSIEMGNNIEIPSLGIVISKKPTQQIPKPRY